MAGSRRGDGRDCGPATTEARSVAPSAESCADRGKLRRGKLGCGATIGEGRCALHAGCSAHPGGFVAPRRQQQQAPGHQLSSLSRHSTARTLHSQWRHWSLKEAARLSPLVVFKSPCRRRRLLEAGSSGSTSAPSLSPWPGRRRRAASPYLSSCAATLAIPGDSALLVPAAAATASAKAPGHTRPQNESVECRRTNRHSPRSNKAFCGML